MLRGRRALTEPSTPSWRGPAVLIAGLSLAVATGAAPALFGCTVPDSFDPTGGDVAVDASWTVDGNPASPESCAEACIGMVRLRVWEQYAGGDAYTQDEWVVDCAAGSITTQPILRADTYRIGVYGETTEQDLGMTMCANGNVQAAAIEEVGAEAGGTLSVMLDLSPQE